MIPFNKPYLTGKELDYIKDAVCCGKISGNGSYTQKCHGFFQKRYGFKKCLLTTSCTTALEMAAILLNIQPGDEVIMPSYTFVSTANAFVLRGAKIVFADSRHDHPGIDEARIEELINSLKSNYTIVIVTHNMQQAARVSDFTAFFYQGHIIEFGDTQKIFTNPANQKTEEYITGRFG